MIKWVADLHIHTLLSPCAEIEMTPRHIVRRAAENGVNLLAITDHNVSAHVLTAIKLGQEYDVVVWPGIEVECREGAHIVVLFDSVKKIHVFQKVIDAGMPDLKNNAEKFGGQFVVDEHDEFVREEERLLLAPIGLAADEVVKAANEAGGLCVAAHIDRPAHSLLSYLGFISPDDGFAAVEISLNLASELAERKFAALVGNLPYLTNSDAHRMDDFLTGPKNHIYMQEATLKEFRLALSGCEGRWLEAGKRLGL